MRQSLQDAIDTSLRNLRLLVNVLQVYRALSLLQEFNNVKRLGENRDQVQPLNFGLRHLASPRE
jgi:hypothetical protein